jgi:hypothetical protein
MVLLTACGSKPEVVVEPPLPKTPEGQQGTAAPLPVPSLAPLATPQQVVRAVDVGRRDPFSAVLAPRLINAPNGQPLAISAKGLKKSLPLDVPKGLVLQGVLQGPIGQEALVEYVPAGAEGKGARSGSLRVGDVGSAEGDSLLPPGWRVRAIDVARGKLVLQSGGQLVTLEL